MLGTRNDPIIAIATAPGRGAIGIVRLSGPHIQPFIKALLGRELQPRQATYLSLPDAQGQAIDQCVALWFPGPHSYTGEDLLELQGHGGPIVLGLILERCLSVAHSGTASAPAPLGALRLARPGEFTERAFLNNKLDLAQAEAVADLIQASTEAAARSASRSLRGAFSDRIHTLREALTHLRALLEATLDFPEEDIDFLQQTRAAEQLEHLSRSLADLLGQARQGALLRDGLKIVIAGQPNVGKSSLLNALAQAELAIVTPIAGTTRDIVQQTVQIQGIPLHIIDTAGLRQNAHIDPVEQIGIQRAWGQIQQADTVIFLHDLSRRDDPQYQAADTAIAQDLNASLAAGASVLHIWNKVDQQPEHTRAEQEAHLNATGAIALSAQTGHGLETLRQRLLGLAGWQQTHDSPFAARQRHVQALLQVGTHLSQAQTLTRHTPAPLDLLAEELRLAQRALGQITGEFTADDLLGEIFSKFCIGK